MRAFIAILIIIIILGLAWYFLRDNPIVDGETVFCTTDAMLCPDGSYVGRVPPDCEFQICPTSQDSTSTLDSNIDAGIDLSDFESKQ